MIVFLVLTGFCSPDGCSYQAEAMHAEGRSLYETDGPGVLHVTAGGADYRVPYRSRAFVPYSVCVSGEPSCSFAGVGGCPAGESCEVYYGTLDFDAADAINAASFEAAHSWAPGDFR